MQKATSTYKSPDFGAPPLADAPPATFSPVAIAGVLPKGFFST